MKEVEKMKCEICNKEYKDYGALSAHILKAHKLSTEEYYLTYLGDKGKCKECGKPTNFISLGKGYRIYCSKSCSTKNTSSKAQQTCLERYGISQPFNSETSKEKRKNTNLDKYGSITPLGNSSIRKKIELLNKEKYGVSYPLQNDEILSKTKTSLLNSYGVSNPGNSLELQVKRIQTLKNKQNTFEIENNLTRLSLLIDKYGQGWYHYRKNLGIDIVYANNMAYIHNSYISTIEQYFISHGRGSNQEKEVLEFIKSIYQGEIIENSRQVISPLELDIYIPNKNLAIEFNGTYWHSTQAGTEKLYHYNKSRLCEEQGIRLIHIYEYEWLNYPDKIKYLIQEAIGLSNRIYARQCKIRKITNQEAKVLNDTIHLQGHRNALITYGLFYQDRLVQLMSFDNSGYNKNIQSENEWEIIRGCPGSNTCVVGGVSKLFKHFIKEHNPEKIFSYCDFNKFNGKSYEAVGMKLVKYTKYDKKIILDGEIKNRNPRNYQAYKQCNTIYGAGSKLYVWERR